MGKKKQQLKRVAYSTKELEEMARRECYLSRKPNETPTEEVERFEITEKLDDYADADGGRYHDAVQDARQAAERGYSETRRTESSLRMTFEVYVPATRRGPHPHVISELLDCSEDVQEYVASLVAQLREYDAMVDRFGKPYRELLAAKEG